MKHIRFWTSEELTVSRGAALNRDFVFLKFRSAQNNMNNDLLLSLCRYAARTVLVFLCAAVVGVFFWLAQIGSF